jgi:hypothetical protein
VVQPYVTLKLLLSFAVSFKRIVSISDEVFARMGMSAVPYITKEHSVKKMCVTVRSARADAEK